MDGHKEEASLKCTEHVVAFVDVLGASQSIREDSNGLLNVVNDLYSAAKKLCKEGKMAPNCSRIKIKTFSDNILFAYETNRTDRQSQDAFGPICIMTQYLGVFQTLALHRHLLVRGGVTIGDLYIDENFVWGKGLLRAYELESSVAIFPRIVVDSSIVEEINKTKFSGGNKFDACKVGQDSDLLFFIDYLKGYQEVGVDLDPLIVGVYNTTCQKETGESPNRMSQKLCWQVQYMSKYLSFDLWHPELRQAKKPR